MLRFVMWCLFRTLVRHSKCHVFRCSGLREWWWWLKFMYFERLRCCLLEYLCVSLKRSLLTLHRVFKQFLKKFWGITLLSDLNCYALLQVLLCTLLQHRLSLPLPYRHHRWYQHLEVFWLPEGCVLSFFWTPPTACLCSWNQALTLWFELREAVVSSLKRRCCGQLACMPCLKLLL